MLFPEVIYDFYFFLHALLWIQSTQYLCSFWRAFGLISSDKWKKANMSDKKAVIKNADMSDEMQQDAVDCAMQAMEKYNIEKDIAAYVKKVRLAPQ